MLLFRSVKRPRSLGFLVLFLNQCLTTKVPHYYGPLGHLTASRELWGKLIKPQDIVIDATCGNGHDSAFLAPLCGELYCMDIQEEAVRNTRHRLSQLSGLEGRLSKNIHVINRSHEVFPESIRPSTVALICYNLGYLPGIRVQESETIGSKAPVKMPTGPITNAKSTLTSLSNAIPLIREGGMLSVTAYPGHEGGAEETESVRDFMAALDDQVWRVYGNIPLNRPRAPVLFNAFKIDKRGPVPQS